MKASEEPHPLAVSTETAARITGLSVRSLEALRRRGGGPPWVRVGGPQRGRILYRLVALEQWMREREQTNNRYSNDSFNKKKE